NWGCPAAHSCSRTDETPPWIGLSCSRTWRFASIMSRYTRHGFFPAPEADDGGGTRLRRTSLNRRSRKSWDLCHRYLQGVIGRANRRRSGKSETCAPWEDNFRSRHPRPLLGVLQKRKRSLPRVRCLTLACRSYRPVIQNMEASRPWDHSILELTNHPVTPS